MSTAYGTRPGEKERVTVYSRAYDHHGGGGERVARVIDQRDKQGCCHWWSRKVRCCGMTCRYKYAFLPSLETLQREDYRRVFFFFFFFFFL